MMVDQNARNQTPARQISLIAAGLSYLIALVVCIFLWSPDLLSTLGGAGAGIALAGHAAVVRIALVEGGFALIGVLAAAGIGAFFLRLVRANVTERLSHWIIATALGLGFCALAVLGVGLLGFINAIVGWSIVAVGLVLFAIHIRPELQHVPRAIDRNQLFWWLPTALPLALALTVAAFEPGLLWGEEGNGYDVLEYHLGGPKEYLETGRIEYLPHNVYTNFPFNVEMLYLWMMKLRGDAIAGALVAKMLNVLLAVLAVLTMRAIGRLVAPTVGRSTAILFASLPFTVYLSGVAYVENGMLLFTAATIYCYLRGMQDRKRATRWWLIAGTLVGLACGCKYPAVPMLAVPITLVGVVHIALRKVTPTTFTCLLIGISVAFAPWLLKNFVCTSNPVFPLAYDVFESNPPGWSTDCAARWQAGHAIPDNARAMGDRFARLGDQVLLSWKQGTLTSLGILSAIGLAFLSIMGRKRTATSDDSDDNTRDLIASAVLLCSILIASNLYVWLFHTHLIDRFAVGLAVPAVLMLAMFFSRPQWQVLAQIRPLVIWGIFAVNVAATLQYMKKNQVALLVRNGLDNGSMLRNYFTPHYEVINELAQPNAKVLLIGDARKLYYNANVDYCVTFNQNPFADAVADLEPSELMQWLRDRDYGYICVDWVEMRRLRQTYGFWPTLTPDLFRELQAVGLAPVQSFQSSVAPDQPPYATLFKISDTPEP